MSDEIWKPIPGYEGLYEASNQGRVMSASRVVKCRAGGLRTIPGVIIKPSSAGNGYVSFALCRDGKKTRKTVHRAVCEAFHGMPQEGQIVRHLNGKREDNRPENLAWGTFAENGADAVRHKTTTFGERNVHCKLTTKDVIKIRNLRKIGFKTSEIAKMFSVVQTNITHICNRTSWKHI